MSRIGVIGAGIAGLTAAHRLQKEGLSVEVLEATHRPGGVIGSTREEGYLVEKGPNSLRPTPIVESLIRDLGLEKERVWADETASRRYIVRDEKLVSVPTSIGAFLSTDLFSTAAKFRLLAEPFVPTRSPKREEESLAAFIRRRLGPEILDYAVAPFVGGVYAGDPEELSTQHSFERLYNWELEHGSLFWGALRSRLTNEGDEDIPSGLFSFRNGLETLPAALATELDGQIHYSAQVSKISHNGSTWRIDLKTDEGPSPPKFDALVCTVPLPQLAQISFDTSINRTPLEGVDYPPVRVVALGYNRSTIAHTLDGFGLLVPPVETQFDILGTLFSSTLFPDRAPKDRVLLTTFVGGTRSPQLANRESSVVQSVVERDLEQLLGIEDSPVFSHHVHWPKAIPQYTRGYGAVKDTLSALETQHPSLTFAGNYREGVSVGDAARSGAHAARRLLELRE